jgi:hypothetical protein
MLAGAFSCHHLNAHRSDEYIVPEASDGDVTDAACSSKMLLVEQQVSLSLYGQRPKQTYKRLSTSHHACLPKVLVDRSGWRRQRSDTCLSHGRQMGGIRPPDWKGLAQYVGTDRFLLWLAHRLSQIRSSSQRAGQVSFVVICLQAVLHGKDSQHHLDRIQHRCSQLCSAPRL